MSRPIVLFDGVCVFCNSTVNFVIDHDRKANLRFAALQSEAGQQLLKQARLPQEHYNSVVLIEGKRFTLQSTAALRITRFLDWPWPLAMMFLFLPTFLRDAVYDLIATNRYRWFGQYDACRIPTPEMRQRFLE